MQGPHIAKATAQDHHAVPDMGGKRKMKRIIAQFNHSGNPDPLVSQRERRNRALARRAAAEGMVLLKNDGLLPLRQQARLALFGSGALYTVKGGTGSGDVNERESVSIYQGLVNARFDIVSKGWLGDYEKRYQAARLTWRDLIWGDGSEERLRDFFQIYTTNPFYTPDGRPLEKRDVEAADAAVYVISRNAGEGFDRRLAPGDYYLTERETADLRFLNEQKIPTVLLVNAGAPVELTEAAELPYVSAILFIAQPGQEGGNAVADLLSGKVNPSGRLTATWAKRYADYPNAESFSYLSGDVTKEYYSEGIYVGYRYFDSFGVKPLYGFGYGLSYTSFVISDVALDGLRLTARVTNTGHAAGKETLQVYVSCPQGRLPKERRRLAAFAKTPLLQPGESAVLEVEIPVKQLASFDESAAAWLLEAGEYGLWVGDSLEGSVLSAVLEAEKEIVLERVEHICPLREKLTEIKAPVLPTLNSAGLPRVKLVYKARQAESSAPDSMDPEARKLAESVPAKDLIPLLLGEISRGQGALGAAGIRVPGSAGETSSAFRQSLGLAAAVMADGPAGLRLTRRYEADPRTGEVFDPGFLAAVEHGLFAQPEKHSGAVTYYQCCTAFPVGVLLAQSFDWTLLEEVGKAVAEELLEFHVSWWLAPGMNIQRNPLCGRNFEYYSEDPLVSGVLAAAITRGVQRCPGVGTTIKHLACNNQEDNRIGSDSIVSERALREIYLRGFEIAVKESQPMCIMTSYNLINGVHGANCYDTCTVAAREEWGFRGVIMSDWTTTLPEAGSIPHLCVKAGNDLIMPGMQSDYDEILEAYEAGKLSDEEIRACAARLIRVIWRTSAYENAVPYGTAAE